MGMPWTGTGRPERTKAEIDRIRGNVISDLRNVETFRIHRVRNPAQSTFRLLAIINDTGGETMGQTSAIERGYTDQPFTNQWYDAARTTLAPSAKGEWFTAKTDTVIVNPFDGFLTIQHQNEEKRIDFEDWIVIAKGSTARIINQNETPMTYLSIGVR